MLKWPSRANAAIRKLFEPLQDIDVYVEDTNDEAFYRSLLNTATNGKVKVARVFGLGGRKAVLAEAAAHDHSSRRALFIIDGDLPWVRNDSPPNIVGVHQHNAYCIENLLICEQAIISLLSQELAVVDTQAAAILDFHNWRNELLVPLATLFAAFATLNEVDPTVPTVSKGAANLCTARKKAAVPTLDSDKVDKLRNQALKSAEAILGAGPVANRYKAILRRILALPDPLLAVSGKDFVIPLIDFHLQALGCRIKRKSLRIRLASAGQRSRFSALAESLLFASRGYK
jgi:hypothetical protein